MEGSAQEVETSSGFFLLLVTVGLLLMFYMPSIMETLQEVSAKMEEETRKTHGSSSTAPVGEIVELCTTGGRRLTAMKTLWGTTLPEATAAFVGEAKVLRARALVDREGGRSEREAVAGRVAVLRREELRELGVQSWLPVVDIVARTSAQSLLIVNVDEELVPLGLPANASPHIADSFLPTALLRKSEGEALLEELSKGPVHLGTPGPAEAAVGRAEELAAVRRYAEAAEVLADEALLIGLPNQGRVRVLRANILRLAGRPQEALLDARAAVDLDPEDADGWLAVVQAHRAAGQLDAAQKAAEQAIELYEVHDSRLKDLAAEMAKSPVELALERKEGGNGLFRAHRFGEARDLYALALEALPYGYDEELRAACLSNRAACAQQLHEWEAVISDATEALSIQPDNVKVRLRRAIAFEALERFTKALEDARMVLASDAKCSQANAIQHRMGVALRELGLPDPSAIPPASSSTAVGTGPTTEDGEARNSPRTDNSGGDEIAGKGDDEHANECFVLGEAQPCKLQGPPERGSQAEVLVGSAPAAPSAGLAEDSRHVKEVHELRVALSTAAAERRQLLSRCKALQQRLQEVSFENETLRASVADHEAAAHGLVRQGQQQERMLETMHRSVPRLRAAADAAVAMAASAKQEQRQLQQMVKTFSQRFQIRRG